MRFTLKPSVRLLAHAFPVLLATLPMAINAADNQPGAALPPPSLMDQQPLPRSDAIQPSAPTQYTPVQEAPAQQPQAATPLPAARNSTETVASPPVRTMHTENEVQDRRPPWYKRLFGWLPFMSNDNDVAERPAPKVALKMESAIQDPEPTGRGASDASARSAYAHDTPNRTIRTGMLGQCVRTGHWTTDAAIADCDSQVAARPSANAVAAAQASRPYAATSPVARIPRQRDEPAEVVPLPPPAARNERPLEPPPSDRDVKDQIITALADTRPMSQSALEKMTLSAGALFPLSSASIKPLGREKLDDLANQLKGSEYETVSIVGYSDPTGSAITNQRLSKRRADAVKSYLSAKGIDPKRIQTAGKGGSEPMPKTQDCDALPRMEKIICYAPDRRVEIEVTPGKPPRG